MRSDEDGLTGNIQACEHEPGMLHAAALLCRDRPPWGPQCTEPHRGVCGFVSLIFPKKGPIRWGEWGGLYIPLIRSLTECGFSLGGWCDSR